MEREIVEAMEVFWLSEDPAESVEKGDGEMPGV